MTPSTQGSFAAIIAYVSWGFFPIYFKQLSEVSPTDIIAWRVLLCVIFLTLVLLVWLRPKKLWQKIKLANQWWLLIGSALLLSSNWLVFVYSIESGQVLQSSLGYFLVPIFSVALGMLVFDEKPNTLKRAAVVAASIGMTITFFMSGQVPWIALLLGLSFGLYGVLRKRAKYDSAIGLLMETIVLLPLAVVYLLLFSEPITDLSRNTYYWMLLLGAVTSLPLLTMIFAARRIELSALGFYQYITPTMHLFIAVLIYQESLDRVRLLALLSTLVAVCLWLLGSLISLKRQKPIG